MLNNKTEFFWSIMQTDWQNSIWFWPLECACLYSISSSYFIAVKARLFHVSKVSTCSKVSWSNVTLNWAKLPQKCTKTWKMYTVMTQSCPSSDHWSSSKHLCICMHHVRNRQFQNNSWLLLHDNTPAHCTWMWSSFLLLNWSAWSSIPLIVRFGTRRLLSFLKVKLALKWQRFSSISDIQHGVTKLLNGFHCRTYACFQGPV